MAVSKVIFGGNTLIDLTGDTVTADKLFSGVTATNAAGEKITGTFTFAEMTALVFDAVFPIGSIYSSYENSLPSGLEGLWAPMGAKQVINGDGTTATMYFWRHISQSDTFGFREAGFASFGDGTFFNNSV